MPKERREVGGVRTIRPTDSMLAITGPADGLPTVREVLALEAFAAGLPEVFAVESALDERVRWVHTSGSAGVARLLDGRELLLSTGEGWPADPEELAEFIGQLSDAGLSCLVVELGTHYRYLPAVVVETARRRGLALVALHHEVKFVQLTEAVHRRIIADQSAALRARDEVRTRFTALALRGAPTDFLVHQLAHTLGAPVVLENLAHEVVVADLPPAAEDETLAGWERRSRAAHRAAVAGGEATAGPDDWLIVPVEARGIRWGSLIALPGPTHPAGRAAVLEQGAIALALSRLTDAEGAEWVRIGRRALLEQLLSGRFASYESASARIEAAGVPVEGAQLVGLVISGAGQEAARGMDAAALSVGARALALAIDGEGAASASASVQAGGRGIRVLLSLPPRVVADDALIGRLMQALPLPPGVLERVVVSVGAVASGLEDGLASLREAVDLAPVGSVGSVPSRVPVRDRRGPWIIRAEHRPLARLVSSLREDHRMLEHGERMLAPLIEYDLARGGDLLAVLGAMLAHPGNRTAAASASHLSRSVFYQRIALIQDLLGADLDDGEVLTALHLALLVRRAAAR